jgi:hypothetical protein
MSYEFIRRNDYNWSQLLENLQLYFFCAVAFFMPFFIGHPQLVVGTIVNAALIMAAQNINGRKLLPLIFLPSLGVLARGMIFGPLTVYLVYLMPFIWFTNALMIYGYKFLRQKQGKIISAAIPMAVKVIFLSLSALLLINLNIIPAALLYSMSILQLVTGAMGIVGGLTISSIFAKLS